MNVTRRCKHGLMTYNLKDMWQGRSFELYGEFMENEISLLKELIKPDWTVLDVGAGLGSHTIPFSRFVGPNGKVLSFEPERRNFCCLCGNVSINNIENVFCYQLAIGGSSCVIRVPEIDINTSTYFGGIQLNGDHSNSVSYPLPMAALDHIGIVACDLIKVDVEGMEIDVIKGASEIISQFRPIIYIENDGKSPENLQKAILDLNYEIYLHTAFFFNADNFYSESNNVFVNEEGHQYASNMMLCIPKEKDCSVNLASFGLSNIRYSNSNCSLLHGGSGTTSLSHFVRERNGDYEKYLTGNGIDIGGGFDTLKTPSGTVRPWDVNDGDAMYMNGVDDNFYDFVYSAHCLEHLVDVSVAIRNWCRIIKPGGYFFVTIPDWELYEQKNWPSLYNNDHKQTFSTRFSRSDVGRDNHFKINDIESLLNQYGVDLVDVRIEDHNYDYRISNVDQTGAGFNALAQICIVGRKRDEVSFNSVDNF